MNVDILKKVDELTLEIKAWPEFEELKRLEKQINLKYPNLIKKFKEAELKFEEVSKYKNYHPDFKKVAKEFQKAKIELYEKKEVKAYFELSFDVERKIQNIINQIASKITAKNIKG